MIKNNAQECLDKIFNELLPGWPMKYAGGASDNGSLNGVLTNELVWKYSKKFSNNTGIECIAAQDYLNKIIDELLGPDYYIESPVGVCQANEICTDDIIKKYKKISLLQRLKEALFGKQ